MNDEAVFKSIGQALYMAYAMEFTELGSKGATLLLVEDLMKHRYGEAPVPRSERNINMGGMTPLELRAQCALIRGSVNNNLIGHERDAICARFGFKTTRTDAIVRLLDHYASLCNTRSKDALGDLMRGIYEPGMRMKHGETPVEFNKRKSRQEHEFSLRAIARRHSIGRDTLHRDQLLLRKLCNAIEVRAQARMEEVFIKAGLLPDPSKRLNSMLFGD